MATFLYFIPNPKRRGTRIDYAAHDVDYAFGGETAEDVPLSGSGPGGERGNIARVSGRSIGPNGQELPLAYLSDRQTWRRVGGTKAWVGYWNEAKPTPADLARPRITPGPTVELLDGNPWTVPLATICAPSADKVFVRYIELPSVTDCDDDGKWTSDRVEARCARILEIAEEIWPKAYANSDLDGRLSIDFGDQRDLALEVLQHNYRIGKSEIGALSLCTTELLNQILLELVDFPTAIEFLKKKLAATASETCDTVPGVTA